ncbi:MAG: DUF6273 domain-containing protein [Clostridia bacterium]|nr:DUF6273 domain-containing protein [Clostridia bacterium]
MKNVAVPANKNPDYNTSPGQATNDKVFLLSIKEAEKYFSSDSARPCKPTNHTIVKGAYVNSDNGNCCWWLRSPGLYGSDVACVFDDGLVNHDGFDVHSGSVAVRPALWIDLTA